MKKSILLLFRVQSETALISGGGEQFSRKLHQHRAKSSEGELEAATQEKNTSLKDKLVHFRQSCGQKGKL